jgi:hypothetical protein
MMFHYNDDEYYYLLFIIIELMLCIGDIHLRYTTCFLEFLSVVLSELFHHIKNKIFRYRRTLCV